MVTKLNAPTRALTHDALALGLAKGSLRPGSRTAWAGLTSLALAALAPTFASAQGINGARPPAAVGGADRPFTIGVQEITTYDSNPARGSTFGSDLRGLQKDEIILSPSVTVGYSRSVGLQGVALTGVFGYDDYTKNHNLSTEHIDFSAAANRAVGGRCSVNANTQFSRGQSSLQNVVINVSKDTIQTYSVGAGESCATATGFTESVQVNHSGTHNSDDTLVNLNNTGISGSLGYSTHAIGNVGLVVSYNRTNYVDVPLTSVGTPDSLNVLSFGLQISRPIGSRLSGNAAVFYSHSTQDLRAGELGDSSYSGITASAGLTYLLGPRIRLSADLERAVTGSILQDVGYQITNSADLTANYTVSSRISASLGGSWSRNSYRGRVVVAPLETPDWQEVANVFGSVSMQLGRRAAVSLELRHEKGSADIDLYDYTSNRVSLTLSSSI